MDREELLRSARNLYENPGTNEALKVVLEETYPELKESEDERIRTRLIALVEAFGQGEYKNEMLDYLEKQKEPRDYRKLYEEVVKSDWFKENYVGKSLGEGHQSAEWSEEDNAWHDKAIMYLSWVYDLQKYQAEKEGGEIISNDTVNLTIKWLKSLRPQPKQEWSKEDDYKKRWIIQLLTTMQEKGIGDKYGDSVPDDIPGIIDWLKSLHPQSHWKPSEEQILNLRYVISGCSYDIEPLVELEKQLKQL